MSGFEPTDRIRNSIELVTKSPADSLYRAAIRAAREMDADPGPTRAAAAVALAATLERHGTPARPIEAKTPGKNINGALELENGDGIIVSVAGEERGDWNVTARQHRWQRAHLVHFAPRSLTIRTVAV